MRAVSDGVCVNLKLFDVHDEPTRPYDLPTIASRVLDDSEIHAEILWAYQKDMSRRDTMPLSRDDQDLAFLRSLAEEGEADDEVTPILPRRS